MNKMQFRVWVFDYDGKLVWRVVCASSARANDLAMPWLDTHAVAIERQLIRH